ncbi:ATPases [Candidatus Scalindua japonica]|uniref:non-specific protein-tyrosine kinase n=1 Tax=Candidatus Scalindua japonica TaxID=1284222 RepID=A0A286U493_9BACT|nr:CpsD/CapB family tyrosine-protein kinase [Candidatus Scalindua japonica]GAX62947.1 ATPases [Candidatus Scalindua japonica]
MSNIEKALKKSREKASEVQKKASASERKDRVQPDLRVKVSDANSSTPEKTEPDHSARMLDSVEAHDIESPYDSITDKNSNHMLSAIEKSYNNIAAFDPVTSEDYDLLMEDSGLVSRLKETGIKKDETGSVIPVTSVNKYNVDEHIVSYYEAIGKQTWKGPVMVHFRRLQVSLNGLQKKNKCKVMVFTSSQQKEGKSTIALNMAITLCGDKQKKVAIMDCDFRKPTLNVLLGINPKKGLSDYLLDEADFKDICIDGFLPNLTLIPVGNRPSNTCELFSSERMLQVFAYLRENFDFVIIDTPPVLSFPDTVILAPLSDGVVFIINCKKSKRKIVKRAVETLHDSKIVGFIMNKSEVVVSDYYGYSSNYYYYDYGSS